MVVAKRDTEINRTRQIDGSSLCQSNPARTIGTPNAVTFRGPARQYGSGRLGEFAMRTGRVAMPLVKQYVMPVAKKFGKDLFSAFCTGNLSVISGKERPKVVLGGLLRESASKTIASTTSAATALSKRLNARAYK